MGERNLSLWLMPASAWHLSAEEEGFPRHFGQQDHHHLVHKVVGGLPARHQLVQGTLRTLASKPILWRALSSVRAVATHAKRWASVRTEE